MTDKELAAKMVRELFQLGDESSRVTVRLQYMVAPPGQPRAENAGGGFCEAALVDYLANLLTKYRPSAGLKP